MSDIFDHEGDAFDDLVFGRTADEGRVSHGSKRVFKVCSACGTKGLVWGSLSGKWRLKQTNGKWHACPQGSPKDVIDANKELIESGAVL